MLRFVSIHLRYSPMPRPLKPSARQQKFRCQLYALKVNRLLITNCIALALTMNANICISQSFYIKTGGSYTIPISKQITPDFFSFLHGLPNNGSFFSNSDLIYSGYHNIRVSDFSLANGINLQGTAGYVINDFISIELGASYFANVKREFTAQGNVIPGGQTDWNYKNYTLQPGVQIGETFNKSRVSINLFAGVGISDLQVEASAGSMFSKYAFKKSFSYTYGYGLEYQFKPSSHVQFYMNAGITNTLYTPRQVNLIASSAPMTSFTASEKQINYVKEITNLQVYGSTQLTNMPEQRLRETLKLNSVYVGIGLKYTLKKDEKN